jgi:hypothetical protein
MRIRVITLGLVLAASLCGQRGHRFSWQEACFKNPSAGFCQGHEYFNKHPSKPTKDGDPGGPVDAGTDPFASAPEEMSPSVIVVGGLDWRFPDPSADALAGFNFSGLSTSPIARKLIGQLGASQGLSEPDIQKAFNRLCGVDKVALSVHDSKIVAMVTGGAAASTLPTVEAGWKAVRVSPSAILIGHADAVDQAVQRIALKGPQAESTRSAERLQATSEFWAVGSAGFAGPQAATAGVKRFLLAFAIRNHFASDLALEFNGVPNSDSLILWPGLGEATLEGDVAHIRLSVQADEAQQTFGQVAASPLGQRLATLVNVARNLPVRDTTIPSQKPVIYGLDDGPKVVNRDPN